MITFVDRHIVSSRNYGSPKVMMAAVRRGKSVGRCGGHVEAASAHPFGRAEQNDSSPTARRSAPRRLPNPVQGYLMRFSLPVSPPFRECIESAPAFACHLSRSSAPENLRSAVIFPFSISKAAFSTRVPPFVARVHGKKWFCYGNKIRDNQYFFYCCNQKFCCSNQTFF